MSNEKEWAFRQGHTGRVFQDEMPVFCPEAESADIRGTGPVLMDEAVCPSLLCKVVVYKQGRQIPVIACCVPCEGGVGARLLITWIKDRSCPQHDAHHSYEGKQREAAFQTGVFTPAI